MMKQITWDDQWIGYDDSETVGMKKNWASGFCFGGTMIWSVDFDTGNGRLVGLAVMSHDQVPERSGLIPMILVQRC